MNDKPPRNTSSQKGWLSKIAQLLGGDIQDQTELLEILKDAREKHLLDAEGLSMMEGVLHVAEMRVRDIMIPRTQMVVVSKNIELEAVYPLVTESSHSRFPVIEDDRSEVIGVLMAKDLLAYIVNNKHLTVEDIMRPANIVPESKRLNVLLREFRTERNHMAIVVDEYGMAAGLVTIEDVLEQIVGDIEDEHDVDENTDFIVQRDKHEYILKGLTPIAHFNEKFSTHLYDDEFDTIGGFIVHKLECFPKKGEKLNVGNFRFEVLRADSRHLHLIKLKVKKIIKDNT
ncbi:MAG: transporter associated domain-containing protein [Methylococcales bacterium]|nr:transporter associated domain-containing protein [Methylococcales bacterium]